MSDELDRIACETAPDVLAAALEQARERATARLVELLTDAIVAQALAGTVPAAGPEPRPPERPPPEPPPPEPPPPEPPPPERAEQEPAEALYAYGIASADLRLPEGVPGVTGDARLQRVALDDLALLVSSVRPAQLRVDEDDLSENGRLATLARGHDAVVRAAADLGPVLPLRFGTVVVDEAAARSLLRSHGDSARDQLRRIGTAREWGVKLVRSLDAEPVPSGSRPSDRRGVTGTEYLTRRRQALDQQEAAETGAENAVNLLLTALRPHAVESLQRGGSPGSSLLLDLALLVSPDAETDFLAAAAGLGERFAGDGLAVEVSGPWPPYSFVSLGDGDA